MSQLDPKLAIQMVNRSFKKWGLPRKIKIDNGQPFVNVRDRTTPTLSILWWIGLGIEVIQNNPGSPKENGAVEGLQATLSRWTNPKLHTQVDMFQKALDEAGRIQREVYKVSAKGYKTRISLFPHLRANPRKFNKDHFDFRRIEQYLAQRIWTRSVKQNAVVRFMSHALYVGRAYVGKRVSIAFDPVEKAWLIYDTDGKLINKSKRQIISEEKILKFAQNSP